MDLLNQWLASTKEAGKLQAAVGFCLQKLQMYVYWSTSHQVSYEDLSGIHVLGFIEYLRKRRPHLNDNSIALGPPSRACHPPAFRDILSPKHFAEN